MKQTAMQTLIDELKDYKRTTHADKLVITFWICMAERLLEKEKHQIIDAYDLGSLSEMQYPNPKTVIENGEQYYNVNFKL